MEDDRQADGGGPAGGLVQRVAVIFPDGTLRRRDAALYLGLSPSCLARHASEGTGPRYTVFRGKSFYKKSDLDRWRMGLTKVVEPRQPLLPPDDAA